MDPNERIILSADGPNHHLRNRAFARALGDFVPRSASDKGIALDPEMTVDKIVALLEGYTLLWKDADHRSEDLLLRRNGHVLKADVRAGFVTFEVFSEGFDAQGILRELLARFEPYKFQNKEEDGVWVDFAHATAQGVARTTQFLHCPAWPAIRANYAPRVREALERLLRLKKPWKHGRLIIWHGLPGTGKTYAIRALMQAWKNTFDFMVINDPENLAANPGYYYQVASQSSDIPRRFRVRLDPPFELDEGEGEEPRRETKRRLFILEDSADLILQESRSSHFDKIGKLLNMTDGLFGQGREDAFLLTFNEDVQRIDPAFLRPGRCVTRIEFARFKPAEAADWLRERGAAGGRPEGELALAELYARLLEGKGEAAVRDEAARAIGFATTK